LLISDACHKIVTNRVCTDSGAERVLGWHPDCPLREGANLRRIQQNHGRLRNARHQILTRPRPLTPGGPKHDGSLLGDALSCRPALMSTFRVCRARGIFYW